MRVGVSIISYAGHSVWNNGIGQNALHLAALLSSLHFVEQVYLIDAGDQKNLPQDGLVPDVLFPILTLAEAEGQVDVAIEMAGGIDEKWASRLRARGGKFVSHPCGQPYSSLIEPSIFERAGYWSDPDRADEIWLLPKDAVFAPFVKAIHRCPVYIVPYLWSPRFIEMSIAGHLPDGRGFGYQPGSLEEGARIAIFEPNISPIKTCLPAMLVCDAAARAQPEAVASLAIYNSRHLVDHLTFKTMRENLFLEERGRVTTHEREFFTRAMAKANMVVSHQLECTQNYLYLDAIYGLYPLVHNSPMFQDIGYYYPDSALEEGAAQVVAAWRCHDRDLENYRARSAQALAQLDPRAPANCDAYARRLLNLTGPGRMRGMA